MDIPPDLAVASRSRPGRGVLRGPLVLWSRPAARSYYPMDIAQQAGLVVPHDVPGDGIRAMAAVGHEEWQVVLRTTERRYAELEAHLLENHPWSNPEVSAVPITAGSAGYLDWLERMTKD